MPLPKRLHQAENRVRIHRNNEKNKPQNPRDSLAQGVADTRSGLREAGCDPQKANEACLKAIEKIKESNPSGFIKKDLPK